MDSWQYWSGWLTTINSQMDTQVHMAFKQLEEGI
jgi:hypothetical protein